jgi:hypothetical protein
MLFIGFGAFAQPTSAAPTPTRPSADVMSYFSNAYVDSVGTNWYPSWGQGSIVTDDNTTFPGNNFKKIDQLDYEGVEFSNTINASTMTSLHIDIWTPNCAAFEFYLINTASGAEQFVTLNPTFNGWNSYDIALTSYSPAIVSHINQFKFVDNPMHYHSSTTVVYFDNVYFWKPANAPTITGFVVPAKAIGDPNFSLTAPTSNSTGAFTYTSSNTSVATIIGNVVTIVGVGTSNITANQAAAPPYGPGSLAAPLVVSLFPPPATAAPDPTVASADVISVFSNVYTDIAANLNPGWGQSTQLTQILVGGNATKKMDNFNYQGIEFGAPVNASTMQQIHIDIWTPNCTMFKLFLINGGGVEQAYNLTPNNTGWNSFNIPLSNYTAINLSTIIQIKFESVPFGGTTAYYDNLYFWKVANPPTITNFTIPAQVVGAAPVTITAPTSNSAGAFIYTSSNPSVATIVGNVITIVGGGTSIITATQAAAGGFGAGIITTPLVVNYPPIMMPAPTPTPLQANVVSLYSNVYTNALGVNWTPGWGQSTSVVDTTLQGNDTRKYQNFNYQGVEFGTAIDAHIANKLHIDVWTTSCTAFKVFLINLSPFVETSVTLTPTFGGWNSFDIPLSSFGAINLNNINQMKFESIPFGGTVFYYDNLYFFNSSPLPITLSNFTATKNKNIVNLQWNTLTELNNKGFEIEKSTDGLNYSSIGFVNGSNNSSSKINYTAVDTKPVIGNNYYRLKQIDLNGRFSNSSIEVVKFSKTDLLSFSFFPNPAKDVLKINVGLIENNNATIKLMNVMGQTIVSKIVNKTATTSSINFDISILKVGVYYIELTDGATKSIEKVIIN